MKLCYLFVLTALLIAFSPSPSQAQFYDKPVMFTLYNSDVDVVCSRVSTLEKRLELLKKRKDELPSKLKSRHYLLRKQIRSQQRRVEQAAAYCDASVEAQRSIRPVSNSFFVLGWWW